MIDTFDRGLKPYTSFIIGGTALQLNIGSAASPLAYFLHFQNFVEAGGFLFINDVTNH
jgi:hypothetical protein